MLPINANACVSCRELVSPLISALHRPTAPAHASPSTTSNTSAPSACGRLLADAAHYTCSTLRQLTRVRQRARCTSHVTRHTSPDARIEDGRRFIRRANLDLQARETGPRRRRTFRAATHAQQHRILRYFLLHSLVVCATIHCELSKRITPPHAHNRHPPSPPPPPPPSTPPPPITST